LIVSSTKRKTLALAIVATWLAAAGSIFATDSLIFQSDETQTSLIELFTSEGCSSCPPSERWMSTLKTSPDLWKKVVPIAFHVDYWDHLGWRDPFASRIATARQRAYAQRLGEDVYTPALVVDGRSIVVGSRREAVEAAIAVAAPLPVAMTPSQTADGVTLEIAASPVAVKALRIAYDPERATHVSAGENDGERLREYRIVRDVETLAEWDGAARRLTARLPPAGQGQAILLQSADLRIVGALDLRPV